MGHIVFAAPSIRRFHLHHRLRRDLLRRGHRVSILCTERTRFTFWREQVSDVDLIVPSPRDNHPDPRIATLVNAAQPDEQRDLARLATPVLRWLEREQPDLVLFHEERSTTAACIQFAARTVGSRVLWTGPGLLPHTLQIDDRGLDADAKIRRWTAKDYRVVKPNQTLLQASLTHALSGSEPLALPRPGLRVPLLRRRIGDALSYALRGKFHAAMTAMHAWRTPFETDWAGSLRTPNLDLKAAFVCVLLQHEDDPRIVHDANAAPDAHALIARAVAAANTIAPDCEVVAVLPGRVTEAQMGVKQLAGRHAHRVRLAPPGCAAAIAATASVTITINHAMATVALLAGAPVVHLGRALYELPGVTTHTSLEDLPEAVRAAQTTNRPALRQRFLTFLLQHGHVWCSQTAANHNGMLGLVQAVERCLLGDAECDTRPLPYRPGPTWPLAMQ